MANLLALCLCTVILSAAPIQAQTSIGIMAGPVAATISGSYIESSNGLELGFSAQLVIDHRLGNRYTVMAGVGWIQKGGKKLRLADHDESTYGYQSSYVQIPVHFKAAFPISRHWSMAPFSGIFFAFNLSAKWKEGHRFEFKHDVDDNSPGGIYPVYNDFKTSFFNLLDFNER